MESGIPTCSCAAIRLIFGSPLHTTHNRVTKEQQISQKKAQRNRANTSSRSQRRRERSSSHRTKKRRAQATAVMLRRKCLKQKQGVAETYRSRTRALCDPGCMYTRLHSSRSLLSSTHACTVHTQNAGESTSVKKEHRKLQNATESTRFDGVVRCGATWRLTSKQQQATQCTIARLAATSKKGAKPASHTNAQEELAPGAETRRSTC